VDAWRQRIIDNGNIIPSNVGRDGKIGGDAGGKWYGGTYGWGFTVTVPQTGKREDRNRTMYGFAGFLNAFLLTADDKYLETWRTMIDTINARKRVIDGKTMYPRMYGDQGWYGWNSAPYAENALELYLLSMKADDRRRAARDAWLEYLEGRDAGYPERALRGDLERVRRRVAAMRKDTTTPDTRLADDPMDYNPASVDSLVHLMVGGIPSQPGSAHLVSRLRFFDPVARRAGMPEDVAALIERMTDERTTVTLVNVNAVEPRTVIIQAGAYGEHRVTSLETFGRTVPVEGYWFPLRLAAGCGATLQIAMRRHANPPSLLLPWDRHAE